MFVNHLLFPQKGSGNDFRPSKQVESVGTPHRVSVRTGAHQKAGDLPHGMIGFIGQDPGSVSRSAFWAG